MGTLAHLYALALQSAEVAIPDGGTRDGAIRGLLLAALVTGLLIAACVPAVRKENWPLVALLGLFILGTQAGLLLFLTQLLAMPPV
jgi:hypothetical protein